MWINQAHDTICRDFGLIRSWATQKEASSGRRGAGTAALMAKAGLWGSPFRGQPGSRSKGAGGLHLGVWDRAVAPALRNTKPGQISVAGTGCALCRRALRGTNEMGIKKASPVWLSAASQITLQDNLQSLGGKEQRTRSCWAPSLYPRPLLSSLEKQASEGCQQVQLN